MKKYKIYPSLLDSFQNYLDSSKIYQKYYSQKISEEEFEVEQFNSLIDRINRVPFESEAADKGTAFNELIDCIVESRTSNIIDITSKSGVFEVKYKNHVFEFQKSLCIKFSNYFQKALTQVYVIGDLETKYGTVELYGYLDMLLPDKACDIKTTGRYTAFKYRNGWQHKVYPYCLQKMGNMIDVFEYNITDFRNSWTETYNFTDKSILELTNLVEQFIEFLEMNKHFITDKKVFNEVICD